MEVHQPSTEKMLDMFQMQYADDNDLRQFEEKVKGFIEHFLSMVENDILLCLMRFWPAGDTLCIRNLKMAFNSNEGLL